MTSPANSSNHLESLPIEILEQIASYAPRSARGVSRTMREVAQREFEQLCREPISQSELERYFNQGPPHVGFIARLNDIEDFITDLLHGTIHHTDTYIFKIYRWINYANIPTDEPAPYEPLYITLWFQIENADEDSVIITEAVSHVNELPEANEAMVTPDDIIEAAVDPDGEITLDLDFLTQWRILSRRFGCRAINTSTNDAGLQAKEYAREVLHQQLTDRVDSILARLHELEGKSDHDSRYLTVGLYQYLKVYLFINAMLLNVWPLYRSDYVNPSGISIINLNETSLDELMDDDHVNDLIAAIHQAIDHLY
jgi:hypothetical protein